jgi:hypothetical protein
MCICIAIGLDLPRTNRLTENKKLAAVRVHVVGGRQQKITVGSLLEQIFCVAKVEKLQIKKNFM